MMASPARLFSRFKVSSLILLLSALTVIAAGGRPGWVPEAIPNPMTNPGDCGRPGVPRSLVCDPDNLINKEGKDVIEGFINGIANKAQVATLLVSSMSSAFISTGTIEKSSERFARAVHDRWGVGDREKQDGILVFISIEDRAVFISHGEGIHSKISDRHLDHIIDEMKPDLRSKKYGSALEKCVVELGLALSGKQYTEAFAKKETSSDKGDSAIFLVFVAVVVVAALITRYYNRTEIARMERGRRALESLMTEVEGEDEKNKFNAVSCPICLDAFPLTAQKMVYNSRGGPEQPVDDESSSDSENGEAILAAITSSGGVGLAAALGKESSSSSASPAGSGSSSAPLLSPVLSSAGNTATVSAKDRTSPRRPMALHCGHVFCWGCLQDFLKKPDGTKCPICREPVDPFQPRPPTTGTTPGSSDGHGPGSGPGFGPGSGPGSGSCAETFRTTASTGTGSRYRGHAFYNNQQAHTATNNHQSWRQWRMMETRYRMQRIHALYPDVMTVDTLSTMNAALDNGSVAEFRLAAITRSAEVSRIVSDMQTREKAAFSGSRGSSSGGFGGGRSSGGRGGRF